MNSLIYRLPNGNLITACDHQELEDMLDILGVAACDAEDVSDHPVISAKLRKLWLDDKNGYCELTDKEFSEDDLTDASL